MGYEIVIRCDVRQGDRLTKKRCHTDAQAKIPAISHEHHRLRNAVYAANQKARWKGWVHFHRPGFGMMWCCPVCKESSRIVGLAAHLTKEAAINSQNQLIEEGLDGQ